MDSYEFCVNTMKFDGDCVDIDECAANPCSDDDGYQCRNNPGSYSCICDSGHTKREIDGESGLS